MKFASFCCVFEFVSVCASAYDLFVAIVFRIVVIIYANDNNNYDFWLNLHFNDFIGGASNMDDSAVSASVTPSKAATNSAPIDSIDKIISPDKEDSSGDLPVKPVSYKEYLSQDVWHERALVAEEDLELDYDGQDNVFDQSVSAVIKSTNLNDLLTAVSSPDTNVVGGAVSEGAEPLLPSEALDEKNRHILVEINKCLTHDDVLALYLTGSKELSQANYDGIVRKLTMMIIKKYVPKVYCNVYDDILLSFVVCMVLYIQSYIIH